MTIRTTTAAVATLLFASLIGFAQAPSLLQKAENAFLAAQKLEADLKSKSPADRSREDYLNVINAFQRVYIITPHTGYADNSLLAVAQLYESIQENAAAVRTLNFLVREYPDTPFARTALETISRLDRVPAPSSSQTILIDNMRYWEAPNSVRVVVDVTGNPRITQGEAKNPRRVFIDISPARLGSSLNVRQWPVNSELVNQIRVGQFAASTVRVVLDVGNIKDVTSFMLRDPNRIVIDILGKDSNEVKPRLVEALPQPVAPTTPPAALPLPTTVPSVTAGPSLALPAPIPPVSTATSVANDTPVAATSTKPTANANEERLITPAKPTNDGNRSLIRTLGLKLARVVIDAGHGGHDTGSIGPSGYTEKEFVLDVAMRLQDLIQTELGAEVVMTRTKDTFVPLESRTALANQQGADLFISIHANSSRLRSVRGVETFFLNITSSREALETASRENATADGSIHELEDLVKKIMMRDKVDESRELAEHLQKAMAGRKEAGPNRGVKQAPFVVLIGANMPSVLAEIAFISNPQEENLIKTAKYRQQIAESLFKGVRSYADTLSGIKAAQSKNQQE